MQVVRDFLGGGQHLAEELHFARAQCAPAPGIALPAEEETDQLPHGIQAQAAWHDRVAFEMATEEPQVRMNIEFGDDFTLAVPAAVLTNVSDPIDHQHVRSGQLSITRAKQLTAAAKQQLFPGECVLLCHACSSKNPRYINCAG
ncbi:hypothetical protein D3C77_434010 [compost metagenome]